MAPKSGIMPLESAVTDMLALNVRNKALIDFLSVWIGGEDTDSVINPESGELIDSIPKQIKDLLNDYPLDEIIKQYLSLKKEIEYSDVITIDTGTTLTTATYVYYSSSKKIYKTNNALTGTITAITNNGDGTLSVSVGSTTRVFYTNFGHVELDNVSQISTSKFMVGASINCKRYYAGGPIVNNLNYLVYESSAGEVNGLVTDNIHHLDGAGNVAKLIFEELWADQAGFDLTSDLSNLQPILNDCIAMNQNLNMPRREDYALASGFIRWSFNITVDWHGSLVKCANGAYIWNGNIGNEPTYHNSFNMKRCWVKHLHIEGTYNSGHIPWQVGNKTNLNTNSYYYPARAYCEDVQVWNSGSALMLLPYQTFILRFSDCHLETFVDYAIETSANPSNSGENIEFNGGVLGVGRNLALIKDSWDLSFNNMSIDFLKEELFVFQPSTEYYNQILSLNHVYSEGCFRPGFGMSKFVGTTQRGVVINVNDLRVLAVTDATPDGTTVAGPAKIFTGENCTYNVSGGLIIKKGTINPLADSADLAGDEITALNMLEPTTGIWPQNKGSKWSDNINPSFLESVVGDTPTATTDPGEGTVGWLGLNESGNRKNWVITDEESYKSGGNSTKTTFTDLSQFANLFTDYIPLYGRRFVVSSFKIKAPNSAGAGHFQVYYDFYDADKNLVGTETFPMVSGSGTLWQCDVNNNRDAWRSIHGNINESLYKEAEFVRVRLLYSYLVGDCYIGEGLVDLYF